MNIDKVTINTCRSYDVLIGGGLLNDIGQLLHNVSKARRVMLITDNNVDALYGDATFRLLEDSRFEVFRYVFQNNMTSKTLKTLEDVLEYSAEQHMQRNDLMLALGGGVTGDITGFAASVYMRGISFVQIPTTLLAAVDASVGGKTAVNLRHGKNLIGTFWQPKLVVVDTDIIRSLSDTVFNNGMSEVIKHGIIGDKLILNYINEGTVIDNLDQLIRRNIEVKRDILERDEFESGIRMKLNFGHTVAHAIEKLSDYEISHGVAVGTGMVYETLLSHKLGLCDISVLEEIRRHCMSYGLFIKQNITPDLMDAMRNDKKNSDGKITFALPTAIENIEIVRLETNHVFELLKQDEF